MNRSSLIRYNVRMNRWETVCSMTANRSYCVAGVVGSEIVVAGGYNGSLNLSTVEKYNPISDTWTAVAHLGNPRR